MSELVTRDYVNRMQFFQMPKAFFKDPKYVGMKCESKMAYMLMLDLLSLSIKNNWVNQRGEVFVKLSRGKLMDLLNIGGSHDVTIDAPPNMISDIKTDVPSKIIPCLKRPSENKTPARVIFQRPVDVAARIEIMNPKKYLQTIIYNSLFETNTKVFSSIQYHFGYY